MIPQLMLIPEEDVPLHIRPKLFVHVTQQPSAESEADTIDGIDRTSVAIWTPGIRQDVGPRDRDEARVGRNQLAFAIGHERHLQRAAETLAEWQLRIGMVARIF